MAALALGTMMLLAPLDGRAQTQNPCAIVGVDPSDNGAAPDTFNCAGPYPDGIGYDADGDLTVQSTGAMNVGAAGIALTADGADDIAFSSTGPLTGTGGTVLRVQTESGDIQLSTAGLTGSNVNVVGGIVAESTAGGDITVENATGNINVNSTNAAAQQQSAIRAVSSGGNGKVTVSTGSSVTGRLRGIEAATSGTGTLTLNIDGAVNINNAVGVAAIDARTDSGLLTVNLADGTSVLNGQDGVGLDLASGGDVAVNIGAGRRVQANFATGTVLRVDAGGTATVGNSGALVAGGLTGQAILATGGMLVLHNHDQLVGTLDLSALDGGYTLNNQASAAWESGAISDLGAGVINNAGLIRLGSPTARVLAAGTSYTGATGSELEMQAILAGAGQSGCSGPSTAACFDLRAGATSGQTTLRILTVANPDPFAESVTEKVSPGVVLIDVEGGTSAADHFVLATDSVNYTEDAYYGAVLDTGGLFDYALLYNPEKQQHVLTSVPQSEALEYAMLIDQSLSIWHTTADVVAGRQADLRQGATGGGWVRIVGEQSDRDAAPQATTHGNTFTYAQDYATYTRAIMAGFDLLSEDHYSFGVHGGLVRASVEPEGSTTSDETTGVALGSYGGWWADNGLSLDAALNFNMLKLDHSVREDLENSSSNVVSLGARVEGGWRFTFSEALYLQPHLVAAYVSADIDHLELVDYDIAFEDSESLRTGMGVRLGGQARLADTGALGYWITARSWDETNGDGNVQFATEGAPFVIEDDLSGRFEQVDLGVSMGTADGSLTAYLSGGATFADDVDRYSVSLGARLAW